MAMDWFRWHHGTTTDPKWRVVARRSGQPLSAVIAVWAAILEYASESDPRGTIEGMDEEVMAAALDLEPEQIQAIRDAMQGLVLDGDRLTGWDRRQPKREDDSAERVRRHRERRRAEPVEVADAGAGVTQCNAGETQGNAPDTDADRDEDTSIHPSSSSHTRERVPLRVVDGGTSATPGPGPPQANREDMVSDVIRAANRGMAANPAIDQRRFRPIPTSHGSRQDVLDWLDAGIPPDVIVAVVEDRAREYRPDKHHRQINTMAYFDGAVREAWERQQNTNGEQNGSDCNHRRGFAAEGGRKTPRTRPVALGAGDPSRRSGWVYE
ncbi:MAG TPA: hypothetical protein VF188_01385 [Longimicrobiales bacterium]